MSSLCHRQTTVRATRMSPDGPSIVMVKRPRRAAPKARTGCATCKIRRVKCGEERPHCLRCFSTGRICPGYAESAKLKTRFGAFAVDHGHRSLYVVSTHQTLGGNVQHLEFYHHCAASALSTSFDKDFWSRTPLQLAQSEVCVRHALIALSDLIKAETGSLKHARSGLLAPAKQHDSLMQYNKSVKLLVQRMSDPSYSPEVGLICCLLFVCFEYTRGNYDTAMAHYKSGLNILSAYRRSQTVNNSARTMIEETLAPIFARMLTTAIIFGLPTEQVFYVSHDAADSTFNTIAEVELAMLNNRTRVIILGRILGQKLILNNYLTEPDLQIVDDSLEVQRNWLRALEDLETRTTPSEEDTTTVHLLKAQHYCLYIVTARTIPMEQILFDQHLDEFKALLHHSTIVADRMMIRRSTSPAANFTFDLGIILGIYMTACRCRCPTTRREAVALLERDLPREGLWDAKQHLVVAKRIIELEERELDPVTGWPTERSRVWSAQIHGDVDANGRFQVWFAKGHWGEGRGKPPLPPDWVRERFPDTKVWREWFVL